MTAFSEPGEEDTYEILRPLGKGAMGEVFLARDRRLGREVALKILSGNYDDKASRCLREARAQARVSHDGICQVYEAGRRQDRAFIAMRYVDGPSLATATLTLSEKVHVVRDLALALHHAHTHGIIHRDVKPGNVLLERLPDGQLRPVLTDFGLAHQLEGDATQTGLGVMGTPAFMSPEQARGETRVLDRRTDVYSLGATLHAVLVGAPPFASENVLEIMMKVLEDEPRPLREVLPGLPRDLEIIVLKCLRKDPSDRYPNALAVAEDLTRHIKGEPILGRRLGLLRRARLRASRYPRITLAGAVMVAALMIVAGLALSELRRGQRRADVARRLGEELKEIEWLMRAEHMLPLHDTGPAIERVRGRLRAMRALLEGDRGDRPILYALGRGHLAIDEFAEARQALERAIALGSDEPAVHWALATTLLRQHDTALAEARRMGGPSWLAARKPALAHEYLEPAREHLERSRGLAESLLGALMAYQRGDPAALTLAEEAARADPHLYEAHALMGRILHEEALGQRDRGERDLADGTFARAIAAFERAARIARSDPSIHEALAESWIRRLEGAPAGHVSPSMLVSALHSADHAIVSGGHRAAGHRQKAFAYSFGARKTTTANEVYLASAAANASAAVARDPGDVLALDVLGIANHRLAAEAQKRGLDPRPLLLVGAAMLERARRLSPGFPWAANDLGVVLATSAYERQWLGLNPTRLTAEALETFELARHLDPGYAYPSYNSMWSLSLAAEWHVEHGRWLPSQTAQLGRAVEALLKINPRYALNNNVALFQLAQLKYALASGGDNELMRAQLEDTLRHVEGKGGDSAETIMIRAEAALLRAQVERADEVAVGRALTEARDHTRSCLAHGWPDPRCYLLAIELEWLAAETGDATALSRALAAARRLLEVHRRSARSHHAVAETLRRIAAADPRVHGDELRDGLRAGNDAARMAPELANVRVTLGGLELLVAESTRDRAAAGRAVAAFELGLALNPLLAGRIAPERERAVRLLAITRGEPTGAR